MFEKSLVPPTYRRTHVLIRPARIATAIAGAEWRITVKRMLENYSRKWGGLGDTIFPVDEDLNVSSSWLRILGAFDPDRFATYQASHRGRHLANPEAFETWLDQQAMELVADNDPDAVEQMRQQLLADHIYRHAITNWRPSEAVASHIKHWMGPFGYEDQVFQDVFLADMKIESSSGATDLLDLTLEPQEICSVRIDGLPEDVQLLVDARLGCLAPDHRQLLEERGWTITDIEAGPESLVALLEIGWLGRTHQTGAIEAAMAEASGEEYVAPAILREDLPERTPFEIGKVGCGFFSEFTNRWEERPLAVVVGDSAQDFCLALTLKRGWDAGIWVPPSLLDGEHGEVVGRTLADVLHRISRGPGLDRPIRLVSLTLDSDDLDPIVSNIMASFWGEELADLTDVADIGELPLPSTWKVLDAAYLSETRYEPFMGEAMAAEIAPPLLPSEARSDNPWNCRWQLDVSVVGHTVPSRSELADNIKQGDPFAPARAGRSGLVFGSHRMGFLPGGATLEQLLERPRPRVPDASEIFQTLLGRRNLHADLSDKGKYARAMIERWGGLQEMLDSLSNDALYAILHTYAEPKRAGLPGVQLSGRRFMTIYDMADVSGREKEELAPEVDRLVQRQVLRRGLALKCERCDFAAWYRLDVLDQGFTCERCSQRQVITTLHWREPVEQPNIYYDLDEVVHQGLTHDGAVPILALGAIAGDRADFLYTPEMDVTENGQDDPFCEVDLWAIVKGEITIGEAKRGDELETRQADKLARIAEAVSADIVVLATAAPEWKETAVDAINDRLTDLPTRLELITGIAGPRPWEVADDPVR